MLYVIFLFVKFFVSSLRKTVNGFILPVYLNTCNDIDNSWIIRVQININAL